MFGEVLCARVKEKEVKKRKCVIQWVISNEWSVMSDSSNVWWGPVCACERKECVIWWVIFLYYKKYAYCSWDAFLLHMESAQLTYPAMGHISANMPSTPAQLGRLTAQQLCPTQTILRWYIFIYIHTYKDARRRTKAHQMTTWPERRWRSKPHQHKRQHTAPITKPKPKPKK